MNIVDQFISGDSLKNLQTLKGASVNENSPLKDSLDMLINLRELQPVLRLNPLQQAK